MKRIEDELRTRLVVRARSATFAGIARECDIDRACLTEFRTGGRRLSRESIDKLSAYFELSLMLVPSPAKRQRPQPQAPPSQSLEEGIRQDGPREETGDGTGED